MAFGEIDRQPLRFWFYNDMLLWRIPAEVEKNSYEKSEWLLKKLIDNPAPQILIIGRINEEIQAKNLRATALFIDFSKVFDSIHREKMEQIRPVYDFSKETVTALMITYKNAKTMVSSSDFNTDFFDMVTGV